MVRVKYFVVLALAVMAVGCTSTGGRYDTQQATRVDLTNANYRVIKSGAVGRSYGFRLFGFIPFSSPSYAKAMNKVRRQAPMEGKATAITNVTQDSAIIWCLLFTLPKLTVTADIVEFTQAPAPPPAGTGAAK